MQNKNAYGYAILEEDSLKDSLKLGFDESLIDQVYSEIISYFLKYHFLRRIEIDAPSLVSQPSLLTVWRHMPKSSVLLECYRDSTTIKHHTTDINPHLEQASADLGAATFVGAADFIMTCAELETRMLDRALNTKPILFTSLFGNFCISERLLDGLKKSVSSYGQWKKSDFVNKADITSVIKTISKEVDEVKEINRLLIAA